MVTLSQMIILWWLFIDSQFLFEFIAPIIMMEQKLKEYQGIRAIKACEFENARSHFKCCAY